MSEPSEMVDRVARAIYAAMYEGPVCGKPIPELLWDTPPGIIENMTNAGHKLECARYARAAIAAMPDPTSYAEWAAIARHQLKPGRR